MGARGGREGREGIVSIQFIGTLLKMGVGASYGGCFLFLSTVKFLLIIDDGIVVFFSLNFVDEISVIVIDTMGVEERCCSFLCSCFFSVGEVTLHG